MAQKHESKSVVYQLSYNHHGIVDLSVGDPVFEKNAVLFYTMICSLKVIILEAKC